MANCGENGWTGDHHFKWNKLGSETVTNWFLHVESRFKYNSRNRIMWRGWIRDGDMSKNKDKYHTCEAQTYVRVCACERGETV